MTLQAIPPLSPAILLADETPSPLDRVVRPAGVLGRGPVRPFRRNQANDFAWAEAEELVKSCVGQILGMNASSEKSVGELEWDPERGSRLYLLKQQKNDLVRSELARVYVTDALRNWEPRVIVKRVRATAEDNVLTVRVWYDVISLNTPNNEVVISDASVTLTFQL